MMHSLIGGGLFLVTSYLIVTPYLIRDEEYTFWQRKMFEWFFNEE